MNKFYVSGKTQPMAQMALDTRAVDVFQQVALIPTSQIITGAYQRELMASRVAKIVSVFSPAKLGVLVVNKRTDGTYEN